MDRTELPLAGRSTHGRVLSRLLRFLPLLVAPVLLQTTSEAAERLFAAPAGRLSSLSASDPAPGYKRTRQVQINAPMLAPASPLRLKAFATGADQPSFVLNLFPDTELEVTLTRTESKGTGRFTSYGKVAGEP